MSLGRNTTPSIIFMLVLGGCSTPQTSLDAAQNANTDASNSSDIDAEMDGPLDAESVVPSIEQIARACTTWASCGSRLDVQECILATTVGVGLRYGSASCISRTTTGCSALTSCISVSNGPPCSENSVRCDGNVASLCLAGRNEYRQDCSTIGGSCEVLGNGVFCMTGACANPGTYETCDGTDRIFCLDGKRFLLDQCGLWGLSCTDRGCVANTTSSCQTNRCESDLELHTCTDGVKHAFSCDTLGRDFSCTAGKCSPTNPQCDATTHVPECRGTVLEMCASGKLTSVDCVSLGFSACSSGRCH